MEALEKAAQLKAELDSLRPLDAETEKRILQKLRLDWNYHSNKLEGNSLTFGETKALILFGITAQGKPLKDHFEITGHDEAIKWVEELVKGDVPLTEKFIRELHVLLLKEDHYVDALTSEGQPTRRLVQVGKYKTQPNHVLTQTGEMFYFSSPEETPAKMRELVEWFRSEREKPDVNTIILASLFHYRFIRIHPFDDGNGRVVRILMNFILMQYGYPPVIIKTEDKENYYGVLQLADAGELEPFTEYITNNLINSLEIMIKGAKGENIEEVEDLDKELALLERKIRNLGEKVEVTYSKQVLLDIYDKSIVPLANALIEGGKKFDKFYISKIFIITLGEGQVPGEFDSAIRHTREKIEQSAIAGFSQLNMSYIHQAFNQSSLGSFDFKSVITIVFELTRYVIVSGYDTYEKLYSEQLTQSEIEGIIKAKMKQHKEFIEQEYNKLEKKTTT